MRVLFFCTKQNKKLYSLIKNKYAKHQKPKHILSLEKFEQLALEMFFGQRITPKKQFKVNESTSKGDVLNLSNVALDPSSYQAELYIKHCNNEGEKLILVTELSRQDRVKSAAINVFLNVLQEPCIIAKKGSIHVIGFYEQASDSTKRRIEQQFEGEYGQEIMEKNTNKKRKSKTDKQEEQEESNEEYHLGGQNNYALEDYSDHSQSLSKEEQAAITMQRQQRVSILKFKENQESKTNKKTQVNQDQKNLQEINRILQQENHTIQSIALRRSRRTLKPVEKSEHMSAKNAKKLKQRQEQILKHSKWFKGIEINQENQDEDSQEDQSFEQGKQDEENEQEQDSDGSSEFGSDDEGQPQQQGCKEASKTTDKRNIVNQKDSSFAGTSQPKKKVKVETGDADRNEETIKKGQNGNTKESQEKQQQQSFKVPQKKPSFGKNIQNGGSINNK